MSAPAAPWRRFLPPATPAGAWKRRRSRKPASVGSVESATSTTSPPRPPSPPSGPPMGTYFSRRKLTAPRPPSPPATSMVTSSRNVAGIPLYPALDGATTTSSSSTSSPTSMIGSERTLARVRSLPVLSNATDADVLAREDLGAALAHQDGPREHNLAVLPLDAQPAACAVATVAGAAPAFLMRHRPSPWRPQPDHPWRCVSEPLFSLALP